MPPGRPLAYFATLPTSRIPTLIFKSIRQIFNQVYKNIIPDHIKPYSCDKYLFLAHKDPDDKIKLRPNCIPLALRRYVASHVSHQ